MHLKGKATGDDRLISPLTGLPCFCYSVEIQRWVRARKQSGWTDAGGASEERQFYLDDGTGRVLVNPQHAQYEVLRTFVGECGASSRHTHKVHPSLGVPGPTEKQLEDYISEGYRQMADMKTAAETGALEAAAKTPEELARARVLKASMKVMGALQKVGPVDTYGGRGGLTIRFGMGRWGTGYEPGGAYRVTEHCLLADRDCIVLGTCIENPSPKGGEDRNLIQQGQNEKTFLIASESEVQIKRKLLLQAFGLALLGVALLAGGIALGLHGAGML